MKIIIQFILLPLALTVNFSTFAADAAEDDATDFSPRTGYACEGSTLKIECATGLLIRILRANYGRFSMSYCNDGRLTDGWNLECMSSRSLRIVSELCNGQPQCSVPASNTYFGDTCSTTYKYLEIEYDCRRRENAPADIEIPPSADYTRLGSTSLPSAVIDGTTARRYNPSALAENRTIPASNSSSSSPPTKQFCESMFVRNVHWPRSRPGQKVIAECPNNPERNAAWYCGTSPVEWVNRPDLSECISPHVNSIQNLLHENQAHITPGIIEVIATDLLKQTEPDEEVFGGDLYSVAAAMQEAVNQVDTYVHDIGPAEPTNNLVNKVNQAVLQTSSNLLDKSRFDSWKDLPQAEQAKTATRMISTLENSAYQVARGMNTPTRIVNITMNIVMEVRIVDVYDRVEDVVFPSFDRNRFRGTEWIDCDNTITLTGPTIRELGVDGLAKVIFATYNNIENWLQPKKNDVYDDYENDVIDLSNDLPEFKIVHGSPLDEESGGPRNPASDQGVDDNDGRSSSVDELTVARPTRVGKLYSQRPKNAEKDNSIVNSKIISASVNGRKGEQVPLKEPILYTLEHISDENYFNPTCSFWEYSEKTMDGEWSTVGCELVETNTTHTTCSCKHLTNFAVLMSVTNHQAQLEAKHKFTLSFLTYFGCILSIVCLVAAFLTFQCFKNLQCDRNTIHKNLVGVLCVAEILFLFGIVQYDKPIFCSVIAGFLHYLFLVAFAWMCLEGIQLYVMLVEVFEAERSRVKWYYLVAYSFPAVIVGISAVVYPDGYGTPYHCWLTTDRGFIWAFVGPACVILFVNFIMLTIALCIMCRHTSSAANKWKMKEKTELENIWSWVKGALVLVVLLGLTWTFGVFYVNDSTIAMAYVFTILNSLQGVFIFVVHCLMNDKVVKEYKKWVRHTYWLPEKLRIKCGGARASISTTPINSSSSGVNHLSKLLSGKERKLSAATTLPSNSSNQAKRGYNRMQRNSSGRESGHLTDSGIACNDNDLSHIYSEPADDPNAYLEPVHIRLDPNEEEFYMTGGDMSTIEGSVADTDYLDDYGRRGPMPLPPPSGINVDKYKIANPSAGYKNRLSVMSEDNDDKEAASESESSSDRESSYDGATEKSKKTMMSEYERDLLAMTEESSDVVRLSVSEESLLRRKLRSMDDDDDDDEEDVADPINNLNRSPNAAGSKVMNAPPNIEYDDSPSNASERSSVERNAVVSSSAADERRTSQEATLDFKVNNSTNGTGSYVIRL